ncbi:molybdate ABC transporter permease subunit [Halomicronema sp. CCY15110]|uniref:molybdate ABC transporter permease subunit n=1 Tax=Halomicronema sp. CCY15110 TaxID=2767773 RepID=UPI001EF1A52B|nr:molybdate ABC transporter permease subunit [Halomicronema sp. CCY15110]
MPDDLSPLWISLKTALVATGLAAILGITIARGMMDYRGWARGWIDGVLTLPLVLPPTVIGFLLLLLLGKNSPVGQWLDHLGITLIFTWTATAIAATLVALPLMYKTVLSALEQIDQTLISSARTLGASEWRIFWQVLVPLAWPGILAGTVLAFARALGEFGATFMVGGSIPGVTQTMPIAIFFAAEAGRMGVALVWVLLMIGLALVVIAGINQGNQPRSPRPTWLQGGLERLFNQLYFGTLSRSLFGRRATGQATQGRSPTRASASPTNLASFADGDRALFPSHSAQRSDDWEPTVAPTAGMSAAVPAAAPLPPALPRPPMAPATKIPELRVNIEHHVPDFHLQVQFRATDEPLGLLGASGSGKSMTLRCIAGLEAPTQGRIVLNDRVLFDSQRGINVPSRDRRVGLVFQQYALFPHLTVAQNIAFGMDAVPRTQRATAVIQYLDRMELLGLGDRYPHQLSGGQQQRVALARALASQPQILLMDEPLAALDTYLRSHIEKLLVEVLTSYPGVTLFITHKLEEAYRLCPNLLVLSAGKMLAYGAKAAIFQRPPTYEAARVTECKNFSRARPIDAHHLEAIDWHCQLEVLDPLPPSPFCVGLRAHHVKFLRQGNQRNTFPGWLAMITETQHKVSLYIKLHSPPRSPHDYHLQAEVYREKWELLRTQEQPWPVHLDPVHLMPMIP